MASGRRLVDVSAWDKALDLINAGRISKEEALENVFTAIRTDILAQMIDRVGQDTVLTSTDDLICRYFAEDEKTFHPKLQEVLSRIEDRIVPLYEIFHADDLVEGDFRLSIKGVVFVRMLALSLLRTTYTLGVRQ